MYTIVIVINKVLVVHTQQKSKSLCSRASARASALEPRAQWLARAEIVVDPLDTESDSGESSGVDLDRWTRLVGTTAVTRSPRRVR